MMNNSIEIMISNNTKTRTTYWLCVFQTANKLLHNYSILGRHYVMQQSKQITNGIRTE